MKLFLLILIGLCAGTATAASFVAFITMIGMFPKFAERTHTGKECMLYETCIFLGILFATFLQFFTTYISNGYEVALIPPPAIGTIILIIIGTFGGIYTGFLIGGLSEILNVFPLLARKAHIAKNIRYAIIFLALGKGFFQIVEILFQK